VLESGPHFAAEGIARVLCALQSEVETMSETSPLPQARILICISSEQHCNRQYIAVVAFQLYMGSDLTWGRSLHKCATKGAFFEFAMVRSMICSCSRESKSLLENSVERVQSNNLWSSNLTLGRG
jgi:hypothetical protein